MSNSQDCGTCGSNGRVAIDGYHGKNSLDLYSNYTLVGNVAALSALNVNLSTCCTPTLKASAGALIAQVTNAPSFTDSVRLTNAIGTAGFTDDDFATINERSDLESLESLFYNFFGFQNSAGQYVNTTTFRGLTFSFDITATANNNDTTNFSCGYQVTIAGTVKDNCVSVNGQQIAQFTLTSNFFTLDEDYPIVNTSLTGNPYAHSYGQPQSKTIAFTPNTAANNGLLFVFGDTIVRLGQMPVFAIESFDDSTSTDGSIIIKLVQDLQLDVTMNTLTSFITCTNETTCTES